MPDNEAIYPLPYSEYTETKLDYKDQAAESLYHEAQGNKLVAALASLHEALKKQSDKMKEFHNTPFSEEHAKLIATTVNAIKETELQVERWHHLIYPNQRPVEN